MKPGKISAQIAHGSLNCYLKMLKYKPEQQQEWEQNGRKVRLFVTDSKNFDSLYDHLCDSELIYKMIRDAGRTQIEAGSKTVIGVGPEKTKSFEPIIQKLKLKEIK